MASKLCPFCMKMAENSTCPHCGKSINYTGQPMHLPAGYVVTGAHPYVLGAALGQGGFGITYIALDMLTGVRVAIKEYYPAYCSARTNQSMVSSYQNQDAVYQKGKERFLDEARTLKSLSDLNSIVNVLDFFEANNTAYLVMEFLEGSSLKEYAAKNGKFPAQEFIRQVKPLMEDIHRMHQRGVIHRDIAPDNIILMPDGQMKLIDFGAARSYVGDKSMTVVVKKGFAPVEQYMSKGSSSSTDVYALAATIYYCITGKVPTDSAERQYDDVPLESPIALGADITPHQEQALFRALEILQKARTQNVLELLDDLNIIKPLHTNTHEEYAATSTTQTNNVKHNPTKHQEHPQKKSWICPDCNMHNTGDFCIQCGFHKEAPITPCTPSAPKKRKKQIICWLIAILILVSGTLILLPKGWHYIDGNYRYYTWGKKAIGAAEIDGIRYFFEADGSMHTGWLLNSGEKFYYGTDGRMVTGLRTIDSRTYYFNEDGIMQTGFVYIGDNLHHFTPSGTASIGTWEIESVMYTFAAQGRVKYKQYPLSSPPASTTSSDDTYYTKNNKSQGSGKYQILESPIENCAKVTITINISDLKSGYVKDWGFYIRDMDGYWIRCGDITVENKNGSSTLSFNAPITFNAYACLCESLGNYWNFSFTQELSDIEVREYY